MRQERLTSQPEGETQVPAGCSEEDLAAGRYPTSLEWGLACFDSTDGTTNHIAKAGESSWRFGALVLQGPAKRCREQLHEEREPPHPAVRKAPRH